jgi:hypothetical protein
MTELLLKNSHLPALQMFGIVFGVYFIILGTTLINGYGREITGWRHAGRPSRMHQVMFRIHTGLHLHPDRTYADERARNRLVGGKTSGSYYHPWKRWHRAVRNNLIIFGWLAAMAGFALNGAVTVECVTLVMFATVIALLVVFVRKRRRLYRVRRPVTAPALSYTRRAKTVMGLDPTTVASRPKLEIEEAPQLRSEVPTRVIATLLSDQMNCSAEEAARLIKITPDMGEMRMPDRFPAFAKQKDDIEEIIRTHTIGQISFSWSTTTHPRMFSWKPINSGLPSMVMFQDYVDKIQTVKPGDFAVGLNENKEMYVATHGGDYPWHCRSAAAGTGKTTGFLVKAAQICYNDPLAELYCIDTKQISFEPLHGIPGVHIFDNPQGDMKSIWNVFYILEQIMRERYAAVRERRATLADFNDIWVLVDEGNDLAAWLKSYYNRHVKASGDPAQPPIWAECVGPLLRVGRQARMRGEFMLQDMTDRAMGGESLKMAFGVFGMAGYKKSQWDRIVGPPAPPLMSGPGRICMVKGNEQTWVQGFYAEEQYLHDYALENRKAMA